MSAPANDRPYVFISYASVNRERVVEIVDALASEGVAAWFDVSDIPGGTSYGPEIVAGIKNATTLVLMCSEASLASRNVRQEIQLAWRHERPILPLLLEPLIFPDDVSYWLEGAQWIEVLDQPPAIWIDQARRALMLMGYGGLSPSSSVAPPTVTIELPPNNLPELATALIGRDRELRQIGTLLAPGSVVTLTGTGGSGKTSLGISAARAQAVRYPDGVWFVDGSTSTTSVELAEAIAGVVDVQEESTESLVETLSRTLGQQDALLLIDNLEQISDAGSLVESLARPGMLTVLATSRSPLKTGNEIVVSVGPLEALKVDADTPASVVARNPAVQLFVERATQAKPDFRLSDGNAHEVAEICARLDGLPLAIELAAARSRLLHPAALLNRLDTRLSLLSRGTARSGRQQTLFASIAWSYDLLDPVQQAVFRRLSVFSGGADVETVEAVVSAVDDAVPLPAVLDAIDELIDNSLLVIDRSLSSDDSTRVRMLETIREFAAASLQENGEGEATAAEHATAYRLLAETLDEQLQTGQQATGMSALTADHANLTTALRHLSEAIEGEKQVQAMELAASLWRYWERKGAFSEGLRLTLAALDVTSGKDTLARARAMNGAGVLAFSLGDLATARQFHESARDLSKELGAVAELAQSLDNLGIVHIVSGDNDRGIAAFESALAMQVEAGNRRGEAVVLDHLAGAHQYADNLDESRSYAERSLAMWRSLHDQSFIGLALEQLGMTAMYQGAFEESEQYLEEARVLAESEGNPITLGNALVNLASTLEHAGSPQRAGPLLDQAIDLFADSGDVRSEAYATYLKARVLREQGRGDEGLPLLENAIEVLTKAGQQDAVALCLETLGGIAADRDDYTQAAEFMGQAAQLRESIGVPPPRIRAPYIERDITSIRAALDPQDFDRHYSAPV